jgi:membrane protein insertase Oxa1/YidC/SpoIIIJ
MINILEFLIQIYLNFTSSYGLSIILLSLTVSICLIPLNLVLKAYENKTTFKKALMQLELDKLNDVTNKIEKHYYTRIVYRKFDYNPLYVFIPAIKILFQLPFLVAAYLFLTSYPPINGVLFGFIHDLSKPYELFLVNGVSINPLPILMTLISLFDIYFNKGGIQFKERIIITFTSLFFLIILYKSPSAIILYWLTNNVFSLFKTILFGNDIKDRLASFILNYLSWLFFIVKSKLFLFNLVVFNLFLFLFAEKISLVPTLHGLVLSTAFVLVYIMANSNKIYYIILSIALLSFVFVFFDNVFVPFGVKYLKIRYLIVITFVSLFLTIKKSIDLIKISNVFILLNCMYFTLTSLIGYGRDPNPEFTASNEQTNLVSDFIANEVKSKNSILIVVLDGYPSSKVLSEFGIRNNLDSVFNGYTPHDFNSNFISTPISLSNLFFDVKFNTDQVFKIGQDEEILFRDAYRSSVLFPLDTMYYDESWHSLVNSNSTLGFSYWGRSVIKSFLYGFMQNRMYDYYVKAYNYRILDIMEKELQMNSYKKKFGVYHFLTFHHLSTIQEKVNYANDLIKRTFNIIPNNTSVLFFSDHGLREPSMKLIDKQSAIFYAKKSCN